MPEPIPSDTEPVTPAPSCARLTDAEREALLERAAIQEYDGGEDLTGIDREAFES